MLIELPENEGHDLSRGHQENVHNDNGDKYRCYTVVRVYVGSRYAVLSSDLAAFAEGLYQADVTEGERRQGYHDPQCEVDPHINVTGLAGI